MGFFLGGGTMLGKEKEKQSQFLLANLNRRNNDAALDHK